MNNLPLRILLLPLALGALCHTSLFAQTDPAAPDSAQAARPSAPLRSVVLPPFARETVWEAVRIMTETLFEEKDVTPRFKIKSDKEARRQLVAALEGQFQVNIGDSEIRSLKRADDLTDYLFEAQRSGFTVFSKAFFQGKVERMNSPRKSCKEDGDCINFIGSIRVPKGMTVTLFSQPNFEGERLVIDATAEERSIESFFDIRYGGGISTTNRAVNWREEVRSLKIGAVKK
jgi:hypothetical protein